MGNQVPFNQAYVKTIYCSTVILLRLGMESCGSSWLITCYPHTTDRHCCSHTDCSSRCSPPLVWTTQSTTSVLLAYQSPALPVLWIAWLLLVSSMSLQHPDGWVIQGKEKGQITSITKYKYNWRCASFVQYVYCLIKTMAWCFSASIKS